MSSFIFNDFKQRYLNGEVPSTDTWKAYLVNSKFTDYFDGSDKIKLEQFKTLNEILNFAEKNDKPFSDTIANTIIKTYKYTRESEVYDGTTTEANKPTYVTPDNWNDFVTKFPMISGSEKSLYTYMFDENFYGKRCTGFYWVTTWAELCWCADRVNGVKDGEKIATFNNEICIVLGDDIGTSTTVDVNCCIGKYEDRPFEGIFFGNGYKLKNFRLHCDDVFNGIFGVIGENGKIDNFYVDGTNWLVCDKKLTMSHIKNDGRDIVSGLLCGKNYGNIDYARIKGSLYITGFVPEIYAVRNRTEDATSVLGDDPNANLYWPAYMCIDNPGNIIPYCGYFNEGLFGSKRQLLGNFEAITAGHEDEGYADVPFWSYEEKYGILPKFNRHHNAELLYNNVMDQYYGNESNLPSDGIVTIFNILKVAFWADTALKIHNKAHETAMTKYYDLGTPLGDYKFSKHDDGTSIPYANAELVATTYWDFTAGQPKIPTDSASYDEPFYYTGRFADVDHSVGVAFGTMAQMLLYDYNAVKSTITSETHGDNSYFSTSALGMFNYCNILPKYRTFPQDYDNYIEHVEYDAEGKATGVVHKESIGYNGNQAVYCDWLDMPMKMHQFSRQAYYCGGLAGFNKGNIWHTNTELNVEFSGSFVGFFGGTAGKWVGGTTNYVSSIVKASDNNLRAAFDLSAADETQAVHTTKYSIHNVGGFAGMLTYDYTSIYNTSAYLYNNIGNYFISTDELNIYSPYIEYNGEQISLELYGSPTFDYSVLNRYGGFAAICDINSSSVNTQLLDDNMMHALTANRPYKPEVVNMNNVYIKYDEPDIEYTNGYYKIGTRTFNIAKYTNSNDRDHICSECGCANPIFGEIKATFNAIPSILSYNNSWKTEYIPGLMVTDQTDDIPTWNEEKQLYDNKPSMTNMPSSVNQRYTQYTHEFAPTLNNWNLYGWTTDKLSDCIIKKYTYSDIDGTRVLNWNLNEECYQTWKENIETLEYFNFSGVSVNATMTTAVPFVLDSVNIANALDDYTLYKDPYNNKTRSSIFNYSKQADRYSYFGSSLKIDKSESANGKGYYNDVTYLILSHIISDYDGPDVAPQELSFAVPTNYVNTDDDISDDIYDYRYDDLSGDYPLSAMDLQVEYNIDNQYKQGYWYHDPMDNSLTGKDVVYTGNILHIGHTLSPRQIRTLIDNNKDVETSAMSGEDLQGLYITDSQGRNVMYLDISVGDTVGLQSWSMELDRFDLSGNSGLLLEVD